MRKNKRKSEEAVLIKMEIARPDFHSHYLMKQKLILRLEHLISRKARNGSTP